MLAEGQFKEPRHTGGVRRTGLEGLSDEDCFALAATGSEPAQEEIVTRFTPGVFNLLSRLLGEREAALDATQEVFLRIFRNPGAFSADRMFRSWIYAIAWNLARDEIRRRTVRRRERTAGAGRTFPNGGPGELPDNHASEPPEILEREERIALVRRAIDHLEPRHRMLLVLREFEDLSYEELAEALGCELGTVRSGLSRARTELKDLLSRWLPEVDRGL